MSDLTYADVLRAPHVGRLLSAAFLGRLADQMFALTIVLYVLAVYASPELAGLAVLAAAVPGLIVSPVAGALLDRAGPARGIAADLAASAALVTVLAFTARPGTAGTVLLLVLAALFSLTSPMSIAGTRTLIPRLVPAPALERANALDAALFNVVAVLGPVLAGGIFAAFGGRAALLTIAVLYAGAWFAVQTLPDAAGQPTAPTREPLGRAARQGLRYVLTHPVLRALVVFYGLYEVAFGILVVAVPYVAGGTARSAQQHGARVGLLWAIVGLTGIIGALLAGRICAAGRERSAILAGVLITSAAAPVLAFGHTIGLVLGLAAIGLAAGPVNVGLLTLRQRRTDPAWLGRVLAVSISLNVLGEPIGSAVGGYVLGGTRSPGLAFLAAGAAAGLGLLAAYLLLPRTRPVPQRAAADSQAEAPTFPA